MPAASKTTVRKKKSAGKRAPPPAENDPMGRVELLLEAMRADNRATYEALVTFSQSMDRKLADLRAELTARLDVLEAVVRQNSRDIRKNSEDILRLDQSVREMREDLALKASRADLEKLEKRVAALEQRFPL